MSKLLTIAHQIGLLSKVANELSMFRAQHLDKTDLDYWVKCELDDHVDSLTDIRDQIAKALEETQNSLFDGETNGK